MWNNVIGPGGARELLWIERQEGYVQNFLQSYNFQEGEAMIVFSHGGLNAAPIEAAMYAKAKGLKVITITSGENYKVAEANHSSGNKLGDLADVLIDNCSPLEDALVVFLAITRRLELLQPSQPSALPKLSLPKRHYACRNWDTR